ncbi:MAG: prepilin-type N-terminal cleavage/methylation domain-containing protein [bacterium]|nr:prepilin-type N-terminal cleavage/methylation domain-containing protein [bacterium]
MRKGFTLIELLVVIAIIIVLAAILLPYIINRVEESRISRMTGEIRSLKTAALLYYNDLNVFPNTWDDLLTNGPSNNQWKGPYIEKVTNSTNSTWPSASPWRTDFGIMVQYNTNGFNFAGQSAYQFTKAIALQIYNPQIGTGNNTITPSSLLKIDTELDDGNALTGLIVGGPAGPGTISGIIPQAYTTANVSMYVLLQGLR